MLERWVELGRIGWEKINQPKVLEWYDDLGCRHAPRRSDRERRIPADRQSFSSFLIATQAREGKAVDPNRREIKVSQRVLVKVRRIGGRGRPVIHIFCRQELAGIRRKVRTEQERPEIPENRKAGRRIQVRVGSATNVAGELEFTCGECHLRTGPNLVNVQKKIEAPGDRRVAELLDDFAFYLK